MLNQKIIIILFLEIGSGPGGSRSLDGAANCPTDPQLAYLEQQLLEEQEHCDEDDNGSQTTSLPPLDILDSSDEEESQITSTDVGKGTGPSPPPLPSGGGGSAATPAIVAESGSTVPEVLYTNESVHVSDKIIPGLNIASAMEGVATASYSGSPPTGYFAVKNSNKNSKDLFYLNEGGSILKVDSSYSGSFFLPGDSRENLCDVKVDLDKKIISSSSFDRSTMSCVCCGQFMSRVGDKSIMVDRAVVVLADHAFPAAVPAGGGGGRCLRIFRCESASLMTITDAFLSAAAGWRLAAGSVILLSAASHLARVGLTAYVNDFFDCANKLKHFTGMDVRPAPIMLMGGTNDKILIRSLIDLAAWQKNYHSGDDLFAGNAICAAVEALANCGTGESQPGYDCRYSLPHSIRSGNTVIWVSDKLYNIPGEVTGVSVELEKNILSELINFFNSALAIDLDPAPNLTRMVVSQRSAGKNSTFIVVGNSHAARTAAAIRSAGHNTEAVTFPACRVSATFSEAVRQKLVAAISAVPRHHEICIVIQLFDNALYFCRGEDGSLTPAVKLSDGKHHMPGESVLAPKESQFHAFRQLLPVLLAAKGHTLVLVPPLPRYWSKGCCGDKLHVTNISGENYQADLEAAIYACKGHLKDFAFTAGIRDCKVIAAWPAIKKLPTIFAADSVHLSSEAYHTLGQVVVACLPTSSSKRPGPPLQGGPASKSKKSAYQQRATSAPTPSHNHPGRRGHASGYAARGHHRGR
jgi:hypothetical protein